MSLWTMAYIIVSSLMIVTCIALWASDCNWYDDRLEMLASIVDAKQDSLNEAYDEAEESENEIKLLRSQIDDLQQKLKKVAYPSAETLQQLVRFVGHHQHSIESNKELAEACVSLGEIAECILVDKET